MILTHLNSFYVKEYIKELGGRWNQKNKGWDMPSTDSFHKAFEACENVAKERPMQRYWTGDETDYDWLTSPVLLNPVSEAPLSDQTENKVKTGIVFTEYGRDRVSQGEEWVVLCTYDPQFTPAMADNGDFLCGCLNDRKWLYLSPREISCVRWTGEILSIEKCQELYARFEND